MGLIYHVTEASTWAQARAAGDYRASTRGRTLTEVGFIHCSLGAVANDILNAFYRDADEDLVVLAIDEERVKPEIRYERVDTSEHLFPHIYGPLNLDAVVGVIQVAAGPDGAFAFSPA
jgi:uncharacterized protein (DUF952 family)